MSTINFLSESFSSILYNITDYERQLENITNILSSTIDNIDIKNFLSINFLDVYNQYPKYPFDFKVINSLNKYNIAKIYNIAQNDVNYLLDSISNQDILNLKNKMDIVPDIDIKNDYNLQTSFFTKLSSDFFDPIFSNGFTLDKSRRTYLYKTFGYFIPQDITLRYFQ